MALRAGACHRLVPQGEMALGIVAATVENLAIARFARDELPFVARRAGNAGTLPFVNRLDVTAVGVIAAADEFAIARLAHRKRLAALGAGAKIGTFCFIDRASVAAFRVAGAGNEAAVLAKALQ